MCGIKMTRSMAMKIISSMRLVRSYDGMEYKALSLAISALEEMDELTKKYQELKMHLLDLRIDKACDVIEKNMEQLRTDALSYAATESQKENLIPCACGGKPEFSVINNKFLVKCKDCGNSVGKPTSLTDAVKAWNARQEPARELTIKNLLEMQGESVWIIPLDKNGSPECGEYLSGWGVVDNHKIIDSNEEYYYISELNEPHGFKAYNRQPARKLTLEDLLNMQGESVWIISLGEDAKPEYEMYPPDWYAVTANTVERGYGDFYLIDEVSTPSGFIAYDRKPEDAK